MIAGYSHPYRKILVYMWLPGSNYMVLCDFYGSTFFIEITCFAHIQVDLWIHVKLQCSVITIMESKKWFCKISVTRREDVRKKASSLGNYTALFFFSNLGFLSWTFTNHRVASEGRGLLINSSVPLSPASQTLKTLSRQLLQRAQLCTKLAAGLYPGTFGFQVQVANHHKHFYFFLTFLSK